MKAARHLRVVVLQHESVEGPGIFAETLLAAGASVECVLVPAAGVPPSAAAADLLISMGGSMSVNDPLPWIADEITVLRARIESRAPTLGVCLGAQLIAKAAGGRVEPGPVFEIGFHTVERSEAARTDPVTSHFDERFEVLQWHGEYFHGVPDAVALARSREYPMQAFRVARSYGLLFHLEATLHSVDAMSRAFPGDLRRGGLDAGALLDEARRRLPAIHEHARALVAALVD